MSFLSQNNAEFLSARLTQKGRKSIAEGDFQIKFFQVGDSEFDYTDPFINLDGIQGRPHQKVLSSMDRDSQVKYPYLIDSNGTTTYGVPVKDSMTTTIRNGMGPAGFVTEHIEYDSVECSGTTIECYTQRVLISKVNGTNQISFIESQAYLDCDNGLITSIDINSLSRFNDCEYITIVFDNQFVNEEQVVTENSSSLIYKIVDINIVTGYTVDCGISGETTITLDRTMPDFSTMSGWAQIVCNSCKVENPLGSTTAPTCVSNQVDPSEQHDPWTLNVVWQDKPIGFDVNGFDESVSGFTGSKHISTMEYLGYGISEGQLETSNTGTTYNNSFNEVITVSPEEQRCIAIIHYSELSHIFEDPERFYKYDDYIGASSTEGVLVNDETVSDVDFFNIYIPFIYYHRSTGTTMGAEFKMDTEDMYIDSSVAGTPGDIRTKYVRYRYLKDEMGNNVGKIFVDKKIVVFDDQELVALLDYKSNRRWTLPAPKCITVPSDSSVSDSLISGGTPQTFWVTYMFEYDGDTQLNGLPCNYLTKISVNENVGECEVPYPSNMALKFGTIAGHNQLSHLQPTFDGATHGFVATTMKVLIQETTNDADKLPNHNLWTEVDITSLIPNHTVGQFINPNNLIDFNFIITGLMVEDGKLFDLENYLTINGVVGNTNNIPNEPSSEPQFGDEQPFPGSIKLVRSTDIEEMRFLLNLPDTQFTETQNPTYSNVARVNDKYVTEVVLLDQNKDVLVVAKTATPVKRIGTQVFSVKLDF
jgi:hypothetical protein